MAAVLASLARCSTTAARPACARSGIPRGVDGPHPAPPAIADARATAHEHPLERREVGHERGGEAQRPPVRRQRREELRPSTQVDRQVHHDPLALRVDGRVGDLREALAQVVGDRSIHVRGAGRGRVVAHGPQRLVRLEGHRLDVQPLSLGVEAGDPARREWRGRGGRDDGQRHRPGLGVRRRRHLAAALGTHHRAGGVLARLVVPSDHAALDVHDEDLAGTQPTLLHDVRGVDRHGAASEAAATMPAPVTVTAIGRRPLRSSIAPTRVPSLKASAAGPSQGAMRPAARRRRPSSSGSMSVRSAGGIRDGDEQRGVQAPARRDHQVERPRRANASRRRHRAAATPWPRGGRRSCHPAWRAVRAPARGCLARC